MHHYLGTLRLSRGRLASIGVLLGTLACTDTTPSGDDRDFAVAATRSEAITCGALQSFHRHARALAVRQLEDETSNEWRHRLTRQLTEQLELAIEAERLGARTDERLNRLWQARRRSILRETLEADLLAASVPEPVEVVRYFDEHARELDQPEVITTRLILRKVDRDASEDVWQAEIAALQAARQRILAGDRFGQVARELSQAENAARGGAVKTSPRGSLLPEFEAVAWSLEPGTMSDVVRLPDGPALILLERRTPAREATLETARGAVEKRLRLARLRELRAAAVAESCGEALQAIDSDELGATPDAATPTLRLGSVTVDLAALDLDPHAPWWEDRLQAALETACLDRTAEDRGLAARPEIAQRLAVEERGVLAAWATERRLEGCGEAVPEAELTAFYNEHAAAFRRPERRRFDVLAVPVGEAGQRAALAEAAGAAEAWRAQGAPPSGARLQHWGPIERGALAGTTSPLLARFAFELRPGEITDAVLLERFSSARANFEARGYVVLRLVEVEPESLPPLAEVGERIRRFLRRDERRACLDELLSEVDEQASLTVDEAALARCPLADRLAASTRRRQRVSPSE